MGQGLQRWDVVTIREYKDGNGQDKTSWTKVGVGFTNQNGSINIMLDANPVNGRLQLQIPMSREERQARFGNNNQQQGGQQNYQQGPPQQRQQPQQGNRQRYNQQPQTAAQTFHQQQPPPQYPPQDVPPDYPPGDDNPF